MIPFKAPSHCVPRFLTLQRSKSDKESSGQCNHQLPSNHSARPFGFFNHMFFVGDLRSYASSRVQPIDVAETWQFRGKSNVLAVLDNAERGSKCMQCIQCISTMLGRVPRKFCAHTEVCDAPSTRKSGTVS